MDDTMIYQTVFSILTSRMHSGNQQTNFPSGIILSIIKKAKQVFRKENSLLQLNGNFVVVGDIHGNIDDLLRIFERCGYPPKSNYLFLGDYVDRGQHSIEVIIFLFCLKILYPQSLYLIRGNHECESITTIYGFKNDCEKKYDNVVYHKFMKCFMHLSYAAVLNEAYLCVHGGISPYLRSLDDIDQIEKPLLTSDSQIVTDIVWSDPNELTKGFQASPRGCGYFFDNKRLNHFLKENRLKKLIRSHESCYDGYEYPLDNCITVFSNTNYCEMNNDAAVIIVKTDSEIESSSENSESEENEESFKYEKDDHLTIETFSPLTDEELKKRRVLVPESFLSKMAENEMHQKVCCCISSHEIIDQITTPPICVF